MSAAEPAALWPDRLGLGEGIRAVEGRIVLVDILAGRLLTGPADRTAPLTQLARLAEPLGAVAPVHARPGHWIAAAGTGICLIAPDGSAEWTARPEEGAAHAMRMNDATADPHGRFWAYDAVEGAGSLYRVGHDGTVDRVLDGLTVPNGPAFTADGCAMYLADSAKGVIRRYPVDPDSGLPGAPETFARFDGGSPDGMAVDAEGGLWTAVWGTGTVHRLRPDGAPDRQIRLPATQPAGVCLDGDTLYVTSARHGLAEPGPLDGAVFSVRVDVPGLPTAAYRQESPA
ncbi:sugar lactone lactonase YvrE [Streptomyces sp. 840.1]|uniref:SMP-30/gluconolactonase/LRE family protein n=1 Tax=Streptomyces sp. 840.1 TaxID=2485152 RepID=UPI000F4788B1|nr:SMP-30/gluconolactonase/LRE family protein [Streptomyces sp. 840.1]ROQ69820.1 sugar lactone lactonase YvrE [Streptomyces sp. 840.1]